MLGQHPRNPRKPRFRELPLLVGTSEYSPSLVEDYAPKCSLIPKGFPPSKLINRQRHTGLRLKPQTSSITSQPSRCTKVADGAMKPYTIFGFGQNWVQQVFNQTQIDTSNWKRFSFVCWNFILTSLENILRLLLKLPQHIVHLGVSWGFPCGFWGKTLQNWTF